MIIKKATWPAPHTSVKKPSSLLVLHRFGAFQSFVWGAVQGVFFEKAFRPAVGYSTDLRLSVYYTDTVCGYSTDLRLSVYYTDTVWGYFWGFLPVPDVASTNPASLCVCVYGRESE